MKTMRDLMETCKQESIDEDLGMIPTSIMNGIPDDIAHQLAFLAKLALRMGMHKASVLLTKLASRQ
jgi:hypothetical protein